MLKAGAHIVHRLPAQDYRYMVPLGADNPVPSGSLVN